MNENEEQLRAFGEFVRAQRQLAQVSQSGVITSVEQVIQVDPRLDAGQKEALIKIYRSFIGGS
jgi:hypothetical protein